ncbi:proton-coupled amino acid transporter-like protein CG1139 [Trichoplusia ni]|uniref:Proton-coupled amino acid transporter-like protein CG1139 n=1 Tax=Trichoplusia ni TaxID=7111 RepID=A0A7E5WTS9_TRINI|nr:proton-coupled amino acid transporter-like protein CG1139 [Trichoplusia ni]
MRNIFQQHKEKVAAGPRPSRNFRNVAATQADEDSYDYVKHRKDVKLTSVFGSVAHLVKGALGGGILSGHVAYMKAGVGIAIPLNVIFGIYMAYCLHLLVQSAQILYRRTRIPSMSYSDVGEAAFMTCKFENIRKLSTAFRYTVDSIICLDLFGCCCCYQIIIAKQLKQLVENTQDTSFLGSSPGYPSLRVYLAIMIPVVVCICLIRHLKYLAPFSIAANVVIVFCIALSIYYCFHLNPTFQGMIISTTPYNTFEFIGMSVFSMSCAGVVIAIENNMREPQKFPEALAIGMALIVVCTFLVSFFGYAAFLERSESPITINFPMTLVPKLLKGSIAVMIYVTHALNFWVPFNLCFYYLKQRHPIEKRDQWELLYRAILVVAIGIVAIVFPNINAIMGFLGTFCLSNMAFIWPNVINLLVIWERPGLGHMNWRMWRAIILIVIGIFVFICGSLVNTMELVSVFIDTNIN